MILKRNWIKPLDLNDTDNYSPMTISFHVHLCMWYFHFKWWVRDHLKLEFVWIWITNLFTPLTLSNFETIDLPSLEHRSSVLFLCYWPTLNFSTCLESGFNIIFSKKKIWQTKPVHFLKIFLCPTEMFYKVYI